MKNKNHFKGTESAQWADEVMASLDGMVRAECNPFFYTRVSARIESRYGIWEKIANLVAKPAFALGSIVLFVGINASVFVWGNNRKEAQLAVKSASEQMLAADFTNIEAYSLVEINVEK